MKRSLKIGPKLRAIGVASYAAYLRGEHWRAFKAAFVPRRTRNHNPVCEFCLAGHKRLDLHHRTYKRLGAEQAADVVLICLDCHARVHRWFDADTGRSLWGATRAVARTAR